jgi:hypothetical protein
VAPEQRAEIEDCRFVRGVIAAAFEHRERTHRLGIVERFLGTGIGEAVPLEQALDAQHHREQKRPTTALRARLGIVRRDQGLEGSHGATAAISARNTSFFARLFFAAKSSEAKLNWSSIDAPPLNDPSVRCSRGCSGLP